MGLMIGDVKEQNMSMSMSPYEGKKGVLNCLLDTLPVGHSTLFWVGMSEMGI